MHIDSLNAPKVPGAVKCICKDQRLNTHTRKEKRTPYAPAGNVSRTSGSREKYIAPREWCNGVSPFAGKTRGEAAADKNIFLSTCPNLSLMGLGLFMVGGGALWTLTCVHHSGWVLCAFGV